MSANPTRVDWKAPRAVESVFPLQAGNRVLESLARQESLGALLAYSDLHERIRARRAQGPVSASDEDLFQTERFVLDEVLQLICDRTLAIMPADGVLIALAEESGLVCRAASGSLSMERGAPMPRESEFLQDCLDSGRILRCDDCDVDARVELDLSRQIGSRSTVIVPLLGQRVRIGVLQAFSNVPYVFSDDDLRCLDLFAELILSSLRPEDQDRRVNWLAGVMDEVLHPKPPAPAQAAASTFATPVVEATPEPLVVAVARIRQPAAASADPIPNTEYFAPDIPPVAEESIPAPLILPSAISARTLHPGLNVVLALVAIAALFSAGVWFGIRHREAMTRTAPLPAPAVVQPTPVASTTTVSDHLLDPKTDLSPVLSSTESKLAVLPKITGIRHWATPIGSTVVIDMQDQVPYEVHRLMSPERIYFDLHDTALVPDLEGKSIPVGDISLTRVRVAQPVSGVTRVVLDTRDGSNFSVSMESNPYRLVVELRTADRSLVAANPSETTSKTATTALSVRPQGEPLGTKAGRLRIALDAGHGGWDLGTAGRNGLLEKDLVLDVTRRLGKLLQARLDSEVIFTRTNDTYLPLDERADFANQAQADLFVSVHANYSSSASARGVETYYTNSFLPPGSKEIETREAGAPQPTEVSLTASELRGKIDESRRLAASIQKSLYNTLSANNSGIRDRGVKDSQFVVLTGTTMPAILTEISFVSSPADEHKLQSAEYRQQIAEALYKGIARYEAASRRVKLAEARTGSVRQ